MLRHGVIIVYVHVHVLVPLVSTKGHIECTNWCPVREHESLGGNMSTREQSCLWIDCERGRSILNRIVVRGGRFKHLVYATEIEKCAEREGISEESWYPSWDSIPLRGEQPSLVAVVIQHWIFVNVGSCDGFPIVWIHAVI